MSEKIRDSFIFYRSFFQSTKRLSKEDKAELFDAICSYALDGESIEMSAVPDAIFSVIKPNLDANRRKWENGCKEKKKTSKGKVEDEQEISKDEANDKQTISKAQGNVNVNEQCKSKSELQFESFWNLYDKKKSKPDAERKFKAALKKDTFENIMAGLEKYIKARGSDSQYWKHPSTWLHQECWKDEHIQAKQSTQQQSGSYLDYLTRGKNGSI